MVDLNDLNVRPDLPYATENEASVFKSLRKSGGMSFFRTAVCVNCGTEVSKNKSFCSEACWKAADNGEAEQEQGGVD